MNSKRALLLKCIARRWSEADISSAISNSLHLPTVNFILSFLIVIHSAVVAQFKRDIGKYLCTTIYNCHRVPTLSNWRKSSTQLFRWAMFKNSRPRHWPMVRTLILFPASDITHVFSSLHKRIQNSWKRLPLFVTMLKGQMDKFMGLQII